MKIWQSMNKKRYITIAVVLAVLILLASVALLYFRKTDPLEPIQEIDEQEIIIQEQLRDLEAIREERRGGEEYLPPTEEEIQRQVDELDAIRRRE